MDPVATAFNARRFRLLARYGGYLGPYASPLDIILVEGASEVERLCGQLTKQLAEPGSIQKALGLLNELGDEHRLGIYYALPENRRLPLEHMTDWARREFAVEARLTALDELAEESGGPIEDEYDPSRSKEDRIAFLLLAKKSARFRTEMTYRNLGVDHDLSPREEAIADAANTAFDAIVEAAQPG